VRALVLFTVLGAAALPGCGRETIDLGSKRADLRHDAGARVPNDAAGVVPCRGDGGCGASGGVCDNGRCVECTSDLQCGRFAPQCDQSSNRCVECLTSSHCLVGTCDPVHRTCGNYCTSNADCTAYIARICDPGSGICVQCRADADCAGSFDPAARLCVLGACIECAKNADCSGSRPYCGLGGRCSECLQSSQCPSGRVCDYVEGRCEGQLQVGN
jgi:Cys-rich repeat protein